MFSGHNLYKGNIYKYKTTVSDIQVDMKLNGKPIIISDASIKTVDIQHINTDKQNVIKQSKNSIEKLHE